MARVAVNATANAVAFGIIAALNLIAVPVLIDAYGLTQYGLIVLARLFLPTNVLSVFDLGLPEAVTRYVASARATGQMAELRPVLGRVLLYAAWTGILLAILFGLGRGPVATWFAGTEVMEIAAFESALFWIACSLVIIFPGLIFESIIKGTESYVPIRSTEVGVAALYLLGVVMLTYHKAGYEYVVLLFLVLTVTRYLLCAAYVLWRCRDVAPNYGAPPDRALLRELKRHGATILGGKVLSILFVHGGSFLIAKLVSVAGVGVYDALTRIPRFLKNAFNMTNAVILPASSRMDARGETLAMRRMLKLGTSLSAGASVPVIAGVAVYSNAILEHWLGPPYRAMGGWLALMLVWSALNTIGGLGSQMLVARRTALIRMYRLFGVQVAIHFALSLLLVPSLQEFAFIVGTVTATALVFPLTVKVVCGEYGLRAREYYGIIAWLLIAMIPSVLWLLFSTRLDLTSTLAGLLISLSVWLMLYWTTLYAAVWSNDERQWLSRNVAALRDALSR